LFAENGYIFTHIGYAKFAPMTYITGANKKLKISVYK